MINFCKIFNYPIYEVGGCVRDSILAIPIKDIDIASDLHPDEFKLLCKKKGFKTHDTGIEHGTVTVIINSTPYEHTTFRKDVSCDGRNATIEFSKTIEEDLSRRDFTINAIARLGEELIDPYKGQKDLEDRKLKAVGKPEERFSEDYLRIVRAARFISRLDLKADEELQEAAIKLSPKIIEHVSIERVSDEMRKAQAHGKRFFQEAEKLGFLQYIFPEVLEIDKLEKEKWLDQVNNSADKSELLYFSAILIPLFNEGSENKAALLRMSRQISKGIGILFKLKDSLTLSTSASELRDIMLEAKDYYEDLKVYIASVYQPGAESQNILRKIKQIEDQVKTSIQSPFINGQYLLNAGLKPSPFFKEVLDECGKLQAEGKNIQTVEELANNMIATQK